MAPVEKVEVEDAPEVSERVEVEKPETQRRSRHKASAKERAPKVEEPEGRVLRPDELTPRGRPRVGGSYVQNSKGEWVQRRKATTQRH